MRELLNKLLKINEDTKSNVEDYLQKRKDNERELTITIRGQKECVEVVKTILAAMNWMNGGSSRELRIYWDGDGPDQLEIVSSSEELSLSEEEEEMIGESDGLTISSDGVKELKK